MTRSNLLEKKITASVLSEIFEFSIFNDRQKIHQSIFIFFLLALTVVKIEKRQNAVKDKNTTRLRCFC